MKDEKIFSPIGAGKWFLHPHHHPSDPDLALIHLLDPDPVLTHLHLPAFVLALLLSVKQFPEADHQTSSQFFSFASPVEGSLKILLG